MMEKIINNILDYRWLHLVCLLLVTSFFIVCLTGITFKGKKIFPGLKVDNSMEVWISSDDPYYVNYKKLSVINIFPLLI